MQNNLLECALELDDRLSEVHCEMMYEVSGEADFDDELCDAVHDLISKAGDACKSLSPRARRARLNALWNDFVKKHSKATNTAA
jgi:hypothetical protein